MAKDKTPAEKLNALIKENNERQAARAEKIAKLETEKAAAEKEYNAAAGRYNKAKDALDATAMIKAKTEVDAAAEVLAMFTDALEKEQRANAYTYDEVTAKYSEFANLNNEMVAEANKAICALLAQIATIVEKADKAAEDLDAIFNGINNNVASCGKLTAGQLVQNMRIATDNTRQNFAKYWPK
jgi:chromosome segregation ATPase